MSPPPPLPVAISVDEILITEELVRRPSRMPDHATENQALLALAQELAESPKTILHKLADLARELCGADSAGVSVLDQDAQSPAFHGRAISGPFAVNLGATLPRDASPCGIVLDRGATVLFDEPARFFAGLRGLHPPIYEALLVPFHVDGEAVGTIWALAHRRDKRFQAEDARLLTSLSRFAAAVYKRTRTEEDLRASRAAALNLIEDAVMAREKTEKVSAVLRESEAQLAAELAALQRLHGLVMRLLACGDLHTALEEVLVATLEITGAEMGKIQRFHAQDGTLEIVAERGLPRDFIDRINRVSLEDEFACCRAVRAKKRIIVEDVEADPAYEPYRGIAAAAGYRAVQTTPLLSRGGELLGVLATHHREPHRPSDRDMRLLDLYAQQATEVIDRARSEEALRESQERLRLIMENARDYAIFSADLDRHVTTWNAGAERLLGFTEAEILGQNADVIFTPEDRTAGAPEHETRTALAEGRAADERWHVRKDGSRFWGSGVMTAMRDAGGAAVGLVKIFRDETAARETRAILEQNERDLREALQEMEAAREQAEIAKKAKDHFLAVLSHELRTPLTPVLMAVRALTVDKNVSPRTREALEMIGRNVQIEARFIDDLLDMTRIESGKLELQTEEVDLHETIRRAVEVSAGDIENKRQKLAVALDASRYVFTGDVTRLQQVFWNLLKNASKFTPEGGMIRIATWNKGERIAVAVTDSGIGFAPEAADRILEPFAQADVTVTRQFGGLGLGLAIAKAAVDGHGGRLRAESAGLGKGATFTVDLPLVDEGKNPANLPLNGAPTEASGGRPDNNEVTMLPQ